MPLFGAVRSNFKILVVACEYPLHKQLRMNVCYVAFTLRRVLTCGASVGSSEVCAETAARGTRTSLVDVMAKTEFVQVHSMAELLE